MDTKRASKEPRATAGKRQKTSDDSEKATEHPPSKPGRQQIPAPTSNTTRRPFFGVIDNVSSFSGIIEGPYDFGFAISITVDRQTFKGVVYKSNQSDHTPEATFPDEEVMINFASTVQATSTRSSASSKPAAVKPNTSQEEVRLPDITTFDARHSVHEPPRTPHDSPRTPHAQTPHDIPRTPLNDSPSPKEESGDGDDHASAPATPSSSSHPPLSSSADSLPAIHSVLQGINNLPPSGNFSPPTPSSHAPSTQTSSSIPPPLPPQPQLQRQKQRQKKRQEKKLMELQQQQPARYQSLLDREKSKIPLLGDENLVHAGMEILQQMEDHKH